MASMKKLLGFRQLSLNCDTTSRRHSLKKQFSEDRKDFKDWSDDIDIQLHFNDSTIRNPFIKHAWLDPADALNEEPVIIKKCGENRRTSSGKLYRQGSLENDSLLNPKNYQERTRQEKPNLKIVLAQNQHEYPNEDVCNEQPKIIKPLTGISSDDKNSFKLRKTIKTKNSTPDTLWPVPNKKIDNQTICVPETNQPLSDNQAQENPVQVNNGQGSYVKPIASVIIRPTTAASKREMFQKRTNSAFTTTINKETIQPRRPLIRTSSAPCKPNHTKSKLIFQRQKKSSKKTQLKATPKPYDMDKNEENQKEQNASIVQGSDVITMVSLISPAASDCEEGDEEEEDIKTKTKNVNFEKGTLEPRQTPKITSLRKAIKTVSFQQSSIHAIRSFSASFPARRSSVSSAMMLNNTPNPSSSKEKRSTNSSKLDDDERMPKRRLVRDNSEKTKTHSSDQSEAQEQIPDEENNSRNSNTPKSEDPVKTESQANEEQQEDVEAIKESEMVDVDLKSVKEKQCWNMYCKMTEKGINVSFDTILRGMLTPTEYRLSRKHSLIPANSEPPKST